MPPRLELSTLKIRSLVDDYSIGRLAILTFVQSVSGLLFLGRTRYLGGWLFRPVREQDQP